MTEWDHEFPPREEYPPVPEEFPQPLPETEFCQPAGEAEDAAPPGTDFDNPDPALEFTPPGSGAEGVYAPPSKRKRRLRKLLYAAAAFALLTLLFADRGRGAVPVIAVTAPEPTPSPSVTAAPAPVFSSASDVPLPAQTAEPTPEPTPEPLGKEPVIDVDFFYFSHEHHAFIHMSNIGALHSVRVRVRETALDKPVYEYYLEEEEIESGLFELPVLSTGDLFMENMAAYDAANKWPQFELTVTAWYENEAGDGEDTLELTREADFELGIGLSYMNPDQTWSEFIPPDSFYIQPWAETDQINYVINDPDAVTDPLTFSVDLSWNGRHAEPEDYEVAVKKDEYTLINRETGTETPTVSYTKILILRRPDWMPEEGTLHICIVQRLASTGELWVREGDYEYPERFDWDF